MGSFKGSSRAKLETGRAPRPTPCSVRSQCPQRHMTRGEPRSPFQGTLGGGGGGSLSPSPTPREPSTIPPRSPREENQCHGPQGAPWTCATRLKTPGPGGEEGSPSLSRFLAVCKTLALRPPPPHPAPGGERHDRHPHRRSGGAQGGLTLTGALLNSPCRGSAGAVIPSARAY